MSDLVFSLPGPSVSRVVCVLMMAALTIAAGCGTGPTPDRSAQRARTITIATSVFPSSINEYVAQTRSLDTAFHYFMLYMPLAAEQADFEDGPATLKPRLARSWSFSEDHRVLTFLLRDDARWSDGTPITADDVRFTWQAQTSPEVGWSGAGTKAGITDVEAVDAYTVRFHYREPYANQLVDAVQGVIVPAHVWRELPFAAWRDQRAWFRQHAVSSGPFVLERWEDGERVVLGRNEYYYADDMPSYDTLILRLVPDENARIAQMRAGSANFTLVDPAGGQAVKQAPDLKLIAYDARQVVYVVWNTRREMFSDARVRRALTLAIDRQGIIDTLYFGYANLSASPYLLRSWVYDRALEPHPYDPDAARALLAEAGWHAPGGGGVLEREGKPFRFALETNSESELRRNIAVMIQQQLARIGIEVSVITADFGSIIEREQQGRFDAGVVGLGIDTTWNLEGMLHSRAIGAHSFNLGGYRNGEVDRLIDEIATLPPAEAKPLHDRLQALLWQEQPLTLLYQPRRLLVVRGITNVKPNAISAYANVRHWRLEGD